MSRLGRTSRGSSRSAFTLMELMVAVGILLGVMVMIGTVFNTATKAGGQATATSTIYRQLGQVVDVIESDLGAMEPSTRVMALARVDVAAPESERYNQILPHRADVLMLFTQRDVEPYVFQQPAGAPYPLSSVVQVVYGHANIGLITDKNLSTGVKTFSGLKSVEGQGQSQIRIQSEDYPVSDMLASEWHLARRVILFPHGSAVPQQPGVGPRSGSISLIDPELLKGDADVFRWPFDNPMVPRAVQARVPPGYFEFTNNNGNIFGDYYYVQFDNTRLYYPYNGETYRYSRFEDRTLYSDGASWYKKVGPNLWQHMDASGMPKPATPLNPDAPAPNFFYNVMSNLFYQGPATRTVLDPRPPAQYPEAMAAYFLPACSDFKVEYTYDDPREIAINPTTNLPAQDFVTGGPLHPVRWHSPLRGQTLVWSRLAGGGSSYGTDAVKSRTDPHRWPTAVRITMRVWDQGDRLTEPVTRTIIHTWD